MRRKNYGLELVLLPQEGRPGVFGYEWHDAHGRVWCSGTAENATEDDARKVAKAHLHIHMVAEECETRES